MSVFAEPFLFAYRSATIAFGPFAPALLKWRGRRGKEDAKRSGERLGRASLKRPNGRLAWLHGASIGEGLALLPLIDRLVGRGFRVLVTTGTVTSAKILANRLPADAFHQFAPIDVPAVMGRFLDHWRPDIVMIAESEIWPNMLCEAERRSIPLVLVNARLSPRSFRRWRLLPRMIGPLLSRIDLILAQTTEDGLRLEQLGAPRVQVAGNLKYDVPPPPIDPTRLAEMTAAIGSRPVWMAASTHAGEDSIIIDAHLKTNGQSREVLTVIAPRHIARGPEIAALARSKGISTSLRSRGEPILRHTGIYVADTVGEMGLFYRLASVVFMGKSLGGAIGGQNPIEPAKLGAAVLHGPEVMNFGEVYGAIDAAKGAEMVADADALAQVLGSLLADPAGTRRMARAAGEAVEKLGGATNAVMLALEPFLMQMQLERG